MSRFLISVVCFVFFFSSSAVVYSAGENTHSIDLERSSSQFLSASDSASLSDTDSFSVYMNVRFESYGGINQGLFGKYASAGNGHWFFIEQNGILKIEHGTLGSVYVTSPTFNNGVWYNLGVTRSSASGDIKFYVDGVQQGATQSLASGSWGDSTALVTIGSTVNAGADYFDGLIDDVRFYDSVVTPSDLDCML